MNRAPWKFVLLTVTLWLAFAAASLAQGGTSDCNDVCNSAGVVACTTAPCKIAVDGSGANPAKVCVVWGNSIQWTTTAGTCAVTFTQSSTAIASASAACGDLPTPITHAPGCFTYSVSSCPTCTAKGDPEVVTKCPGTTTDCGVGPKAHK